MAKPHKSGKNKQRQKQLRGDEYFWVTLEAAVERSGMSWSEWARQALLAAATEHDCKER